MIRAAINQLSAYRIVHGNPVLSLGLDEFAIDVEGHTGDGGKGSQLRDMIGLQGPQQHRFARVGAAVAGHLRGHLPL